jgi:hypothetical protein
MQSSYLQNNKGKKKQFDDAGYEEYQNRAKKRKKKDFSEQRQTKRGESIYA